MKGTLRFIVLITLCVIVVLGCDAVDPSADDPPPDEPMALSPVSPGFHDRSEKTSGESYEHWLFLSRLTAGSETGDGQTAYEAFHNAPVRSDSAYQYWSFALHPSESLSGGAKQSVQGGDQWVRVMVKAPDGTIRALANAAIPATDPAEEALKDAVAPGLGISLDALQPLGPDRGERASGPEPKRSSEKIACGSGTSQVMVEWSWCDSSGCHIDYVMTCEVSGGGGGGGVGGGSDEPGDDPYGNLPPDDGGNSGGGPCLGCGGGSEVDVCTSTDLNVLLANGCIDPAPLDESLSEIPGMIDDFAPLDTLDIDCSNPQGWRAHAYCAASPPEGEQLTDVENAFNRIEERGDSCEFIASHGRDQLQSGMIRFYPRDVHPNAGGGFSWTDRPIHLSDQWLRYGADSGIAVNDPTGEIVRLSLDMALVHELEHNLGRDHIVVNGAESLFLTPNVLQCSGQ